MKNKTGSPRVFSINPGSTSTKVALFERDHCVYEQKIEHAATDLEPFTRVWDQFDFRVNAIESVFESIKHMMPLDAVVGRGGLLKPLQHGTYLVTESMLNDARNNLQGEHISNLGCALADHFACKWGGQAFVVDPVSVDEFPPIARFSGHPDIPRKALSHALNIHAVTYTAANELDQSVYDSNFIVAHLGGGISIAAVQQGKIIDVNDASSDGPFSPERTGGLPLQGFIKLCFSNHQTQDGMKRLVSGKGGLVAYLGTNDVKEVLARIEEGDDYARTVFEAMAYQIGKEIGAMSAVLKGKVQAILFTGGLSNARQLINLIKPFISSIAPVQVYPGELEMNAMAQGVLRVLDGKETTKTY
jgi:butyrate kinase